ncbi:TonB-dependent receptor [Rudanella lutea]|uniref:TonB-dependent receptor n=1 Tax=Rudanella lutea TaxID=451374 RepID=UPI0003793A29|nr:TonB-dependent receptor [Rudanella lutea]
MKQVYTSTRMTALRVFMALLLMAGSHLASSAVQELLEQRISISLEQTPMKRAFVEISQAAGVKFVFNSKVIRADEKITLVARNERLEDVLNRLLKPRNIQFEVSGRQIIFSRPEPKLLPSLPPTGLEQPLAAADITVTGKVFDEKGVGLPGVSVVVKGTTRGTNTDATGSYKIDVPNASTILVFSFLGYQKQEVTIGSQSNLTVTLQPDNQTLNEVVVVGFGTQRKATLTGSLATISTRDLEQSPTANLTNALAGRLPGLFANQFNGGEPGVDRSNVYIRGLGTYGNQAPIVIIDGLERSMDYLAPSEIETFTILKDASSTAPFGVRGANGVILITTKRGKVQDRALVNFKTSMGVNQPVKFPNYLGSADYATLYNEAIVNNNPGVNPATLNLFSDQAIQKFRNAVGDNSDGNGYNWDYFDYAFKPGKQQDHSLNISGGSGKARYFVLANYFRQDGNYQHTDLSNYNTQAVFKRYNFRSNIDIDITKDFYARLDLAARITDRTAPGTTASRIVEIANTQPPYLPIVLPANDNPANGRSVVNNPLGMLFGDQIYRFNMLGELSRTGFLNEKNTYLNGSFVLGRHLDFITPGLKVEGLFGYDASEGIWVYRQVNTYSEGYRVYPGYATLQPDAGIDVYRNPAIYTGIYKRGNKYDSDQTLSNTSSRNPSDGRSYTQLKLEYLRNFGNHNVTGLVLANRSKRVIDNQVPFVYQGLTSRITYGYDDRYLFEINAAYNGSENFAKGKRYGFFPAVSAGWVVSREKFMSNLPWVNNFKIRASHGLVGSDRIPNDARFVYLQYYSGGSDYSFGTDNFGSGAGGGLREGNLANANLSWEKARKTNIGIDLALFRNLTFTVDLFKEHRYDIITDLADNTKLGFPTIVGKSAPYINSGIVDNKGIDLEVGWSGNLGSGFSYFIRPNLTYARNRIVFMNEVPYAMPDRANTGRRIGEHFNYIVDHFVRDAAEAAELNGRNNGAGFQPWGKLVPGDVVYKDINGDGVINDLGDRVATGNPRNPELMFGLPVGARYKGFDFSMLFQGASRTSVQLSGPAVYDFPLFSQDKYGKVKPMHLNRWTPATAATATYPALHFGEHTNNKNPFSNLFLYDAQYLRLKTVELGYNIPKPLLQRIHLQTARVYAQGLNLLTWDKLKDADIDPEVREGDGSWYPVQKVFNFGLDITF